MLKIKQDNNNIKKKSKLNRHAFTPNNLNNNNNNDNDNINNFNKKDYVKNKYKINKIEKKIFEYQKERDKYMIEFDNYPENPKNNFEKLQKKNIENIINDLNFRINSCRKEINEIKNNNNNIN